MEGWGPPNRYIINLMVYCVTSTVLCKSSDIRMLRIFFSLMDEKIEEIGEEPVVLPVTSMN